jgi:hypothetical protein
VEEVIVKGRGDNQTKVVQVISDDETVEFGFLLSRKEKKWVCDCILAVIKAAARE